MNASSKSTTKIAQQENEIIKANAPNALTSNMPNGGIIRIVKKRITYTSMWKAIQKIAHPVSFEELKRFYKL